jgi:hypothetical protein
VPHETRLRGYVVGPGEGCRTGPGGQGLRTVDGRQPHPPRNLPHVFRSVGGPARALLIVTPGGLDGYFEELSAALVADAGPDRIRTIQRAYGIARS